MAIEALAGVPSPEAGEGRVGATAAQLDALFAGENNPHPDPPPAWGREKSSVLSHLRLPCLAGKRASRVVVIARDDALLAGS
jgi:hypothetical protein